MSYSQREIRYNLQAEPAFNWWVSFVLKKRERVISLVKQRNARFLKRNQQFGIDLPKNVEEARILDEKMAILCG